MVMKLNRKNLNPSSLFLFSLAVFGLQLGFWFLYWPGIYSPDVSYAYACAEAQQGISCFLTENSLLWAGINYLSSYWNSSFSVFLLVQIFVLSFVYTFGFRVFSFSIRQRALYLFLFCFQLASLLPFRMAVFVERDTLYSILWFFVVLLFVDSWMEKEGFKRFNRGSVGPKQSIFGFVTSDSQRFWWMAGASLLASLLRAEGWFLFLAFLLVWRVHQKGFLPLKYFFSSVFFVLICFFGIQSLQRWINPSAQSSYFSHFTSSYVPFFVWEKRVPVLPRDEEFLKQIYQYPPVDPLIPEVQREFFSQPQAVERLSRLSLKLLVSNPHEFVIHRVLLLERSFHRTFVHYDQFQLSEIENVNPNLEKQPTSWRKDHLRFQGPFQSLARTLEKSLESAFSRDLFRLFFFQPILGFMALGILVTFCFRMPSFFPVLAIPLLHFLFVFFFQFAAMPKHLYLEYLMLLLLPVLMGKRSLRI